MYESKYSVKNKLSSHVNNENRNFTSTKRKTKTDSMNVPFKKPNNNDRKSSHHNAPITNNVNNVNNVNNINNVKIVDQQRQALPISKCKQQILAEVRKSDTLVLMGETGSGKTTQIPQFLLDAGYGKKGIIGITQPRRVAAITIAKRVAVEQNCRLGEKVGYTVRFEDCTSPQTQIRYLTDGSLLREALADRLLRHYSVLMLDEAHERTVDTDVLFGIVKEAQRQRQLLKITPLKIIVTSATMDIDHFSEYFGVPGMYLEGRTFPVRVMHTKIPQSDYFNAVLVTIFDIHRKTPLGDDMLVFLTGQEEIEAMAQQLRQISKVSASVMAPVRVYPLYAQLPQNKQLDCFLPAPASARKIILATNIAETSVTIPGIRCVIDSGYVKKRVFNPVTGFDVLRVVRISQAQAWQRHGRAGRDAPGICYRTYTTGEMAEFAEMPKPEILCSNISSTVLQLLALGIDCRTFDFMDRPSPKAISFAHEQLKSLNAIRSIFKPELTKLGKDMARFPLDPVYSRLILTAPSYGCLNEILTLVAMMSSENVFITTTEKRELANLAHAKFYSKQGDHLTALNVFNAFNKTEKPKVWCHDNFLNVRNLTYAREVRKQLLEIANHLNLKIKSCGNNFDVVRKCLVAGLFNNIAKLQKDKCYLTLNGKQRAKIHPSSVYCGKYNPDFVIFTDIVLTERTFIRQLTEINFEWIAELLPKYAHLK